MENNQSSLSSSVKVLGVTLGLSVLLSTAVAAYTFYKIRMADNSLSVTGSASTEVLSDKVKWIASINRQIKVSTIKSGYALMATDMEAVKKFYGERGVDLKALVISPISMEEIYKYDPNGVSQEKEYNLRQTIELSSDDVTAITVVARDAAANLPAQGVIFQTQTLAYYYSKLPELRVSLLSEAIKDAKARAEKIVEPSGQKVGSLKSASSGVVQLLPQNSVDISDYGTYDTSSINKTVMITVRAAFSIR